MGKSFTCHTRSVVDTVKMLRYVVPIATSGVVVALLFLGSVGCWPLSNDPSEAPNVDATITAALLALEANRQGADSIADGDASVPAAALTDPSLVAPTPSAFSIPTDIPSPSPTYAQTATAFPPGGQSQADRPTQSPAPDSSPPTQAPSMPGAAATALPQPSYTPTLTAQPADDAGEQRPSILFAGQLLDGSAFDLNNTIGTPTLLVFWAPW